MGTELLIRKNELIRNRSTRIAICLILDASPSMGNTNNSYGERNSDAPIDSLNCGVKAFYKAIKGDVLARHASDVSIIAFSSEPRIVKEFGSIDDEDAPEIHLMEGGTSLGEAIKLGLNLLDSRKDEYKQTGRDYYQPWLVLMTDGSPTDKSHEEVKSRLEKLTINKQLSFFPIGIGPYADLAVLNELSPLRPAMRLKGLCFEEFFEWLGKSVKAVSRSAPGDEVQLDKSIESWLKI